MSKLLNLIKNQIANPIKIILLKRKKAADGYNYSEIQGNKMALDLYDDGLSRELILTGAHEPNSTKYFKEILKPGMNIVDIGSNIGYYALIEAKSGANVISFEPTLKCFQILKKNIEINQLNNKITALQLAVSDKSQNEKLYQSFSYDRNSIIPVGNKSTSVKAISLDQYFIQTKIKKIDIIRMDIEGGELKAINGMKKLLTKNPPKYLFIELHPVQLALIESSIEKVLDLICSFGYKMKKGFYEPDPTLIKFNSIKEVLKRAINSRQFFNTILISIKGTKMENEYENLEDLIKNKYLHSRAVQVFFEANRKP